MSLLDRLDAARSLAHKGGLPMRRTDAALYDLLATIKAICEDVARDGVEDELRRIYWGQNRRAAKRQRYVERGTDAHILACRYVLDGEDSRNSTYRYALALREAEKRQIAAQDLAEWMAGNGGVNALYKARETSTKRGKVSTLHLTSPVDVVTGVRFTITLVRLPNGYFDVVMG